MAFDELVWSQVAYNTCKDNSNCINLSGMKNITSYWHFYVINLNMELTKTSLNTGNEMKKN
jgi:hypothetical protein